MCARLNDAIMKARLSRSAVAKRAEISPRIVYKMMTEGEHVRRVTVAKVAEALGVSLEYLACESDEPKLRGPVYESVRSTPMIVCESDEAKEREITLADAVKAVARQTGVDEARVREIVAGLMLGARKEGGEA